MRTAEQPLFTSFNKEISDSVTVSPQYMEQRIKDINADLWTLTKHFSEEYNEIELYAGAEKKVFDMQKKLLTK